MRPRGTWLLTALVVLFFAEGQRAWIASLLALPDTDGALGPLLAALLPVPVLVAPLLPLGKIADRRSLVVMAAVGVAAARLALMHPALLNRAVAGTVVVVCAVLFLSWAVGRAEQRELAAGLVLGLSVDQLLRLAGSTYDLSLQPVWVPVQALLSLGLVACALYWRRTAKPAPDGGGLERRGAGLRLRSAIALGPLLFLDLHVLGLPPVIAHWGGIGYGAASLLSACAAGAALALTVGSGGALRGRKVVVGLSVLVAVAPLIGWWVDGSVAGVVAGLMAAAHGAALLLMARSLDPASGRRSGRVVSAAAGLFLVLTILYSATMADLEWLSLPGGPVWVLGSAAILLLGSAVLLPQPVRRVPLMGRVAAAAAGVAVVAAALVIPRFTMEPGGIQETARLEANRLRAGSANVARGFGADGRFDPAAIADSIATADPDVLALQGAPVGLPVAYGVDLPRWLGRRLAMSAARPHGDRRRPGRRSPPLLLRPGLLQPLGEGDVAGASRRDRPGLAQIRVAGRPVDIRTSSGSAPDVEDRSELLVYLPVLGAGRSAEHQEALSARGLDPVGANQPRHAFWVRGVRAAGPVIRTGPGNAPQLLVLPLQPAPRPVRSPDP